MAVFDQTKNLEDQRKELMAKLGKIYYKTLKSTGKAAPGEAVEIIAEIDRIEAQMRGTTGTEMEEQGLEGESGYSSEYQGSVCPKCGAPVEPDQVFCVNCGTRLDAELESEEAETSEEPEAEGACPRCGAPAEAGQSFCIVCGNRLEGEEIAGGRPAQPSGPKICPVCGKVLSPQMRFCTACGTKLE